MALYSVLPWIVAQAEQAAAEPATDELGGVLRLLIAAGVIVGSFVVGALLARALRLPEYALKLGVVVFALVAGVAVCVAGWPPKLGIDLSGGVVLVYEVDTEQTKPSWMPSAIAQLTKELNADGENRIEVRSVGADKIEIAAPEGFDPEAVDNAVSELRKSVDISFESAGEPRSENGKTVFAYTADQKQKNVVMNDLIAAVGRRINPGGVKELTIRQYGAEQLEVIIPEVDKQEVEQIKKRISTSGLLEFRIVANQNDDRDIIRAGEKTVGNDVYIGGSLVGRWVKAAPDFFLGPEALASFRETPARGREVLVRIDRFNVDGGNLDTASKGYDQGQLAVDFSFDAGGAQRFGQLTSQNLPDTTTGLYRHLGIVLDNEMLSAPRINDTIRGRGQITGNFTDKDVEFLVDVLNAGSLPATLRPEPISEHQISAQLGDDTIRRGSLAMVISTGAILIFMLVYYRWSGIVADFAVVVNVIITVALMILIKAAFTLPGLAGLVLTVGMAVDANVLIYERMREEMERGASLRMAIRNGFSRATATIIDSNLTTLITAVVLYVIGTDQIKGFAVTLILGLLVSMFTAIFVSRVIFDVAEKKRWLTQLKMMKLIGHTNFNFIRWRTPAIVVSIVLIAVGLGAAANRGKELLDIDFTGGSSVQLLFAGEEAQNIAEIRKAVAELPDVAVSSMGEEEREFKIDTSEPDIEKVEATLQEKFGDALQTYSMSYEGLTTIEPPAADGQPSDAQPAEAAPKSDTPASIEPAEGDSQPPQQTPATTPAPEASTDSKASDAPAADPAASDAPDEPAAPQSSLPLRRQGRSIQLASLDESAALAALITAQDAPAEGDQPAAAEAAAEPADAPAEAPAQPPASETEPQDSAPAAEAPAGDAEGTLADAAAPAADISPEQPADASLEGNSLIGGSRVNLKFAQEISYVPLSEMIREQLTAAGHVNVPYVLENPQYQPGSDATYADWTISIGLDQDQTKALLTAIQKELSETPVFPGSSQIGGKVAADTQLMALYAMLASMVMIVIYVWMRFQNLVFGLAAVVALLHDVLVAVACLALSAYLSPYLGALLVDPFKISLSVVAALLTIVGFSINDTIVTFDRIREVRGKSPHITADMINLGVNQTLSRTLITSGTVMMASVILYFVGGPGIHAFAYTMVVGVVAGTFSSIYIAAPIILWMQRPLSKPAAARSALGTEARRASA
ncbi:MAG: protein translocase subunit SecD [Pirellulales bacterium]